MASQQHGNVWVLQHASHDITCILPYEKLPACSCEQMCMGIPSFHGCVHDLAYIPCHVELMWTAHASQALTSFRDHAASLLLATPAAARGLDLPEIAYIYNLDPPATAVDYVHRAGRAGRIGSSSSGT